MLNRKSYHEVRAHVQKMANELDMDYGLWKDTFGEYTFHILPRPENRYGWELQCEVVRPEIWKMSEKEETNKEIENE